MAVEQYAKHIPYLRRFARALTGSQRDGDLYVKLALQALLESGAEAEGLSAKLSLYRAFTKIWSQTGAELEADTTGEQSPANIVRRLAPLKRQAYVLSALEGMSEQDISSILDVPMERTEALLATAEEDIAKELRTSVFIIEDEPIIAADISGIVEQLGHSVIDVAATHKEALSMVHDTKPGIILSDVNLADGSSGINAVEDILKSYDVPVIFITAFPEQLLTGDKPEPAYLISKPFEPENLKAAISQALFFHNQ